MKKMAIGSSLLLFLAACIWGVAFVAQSVGMEYMGPFTFNGTRFLIGGTVLLPHGIRDSGGAYVERRDLLRTGHLLCFFEPADRHHVHYGRKSRIYYDAVYYYRARVRAVPAQESGGEGLEGGAGGSSWNVSALHKREFFHWEGGCFGLPLCRYFFDTYCGDRSFFTENRRSSPFLHPVLYGGHYLYCRGFYDGTAVLGSDFQRDCSAVVCGRDVLRGRVYVTDHRTEKPGSDGSISDSQPGIRSFRTGRMVHTGAGFDGEGIIRMRPCICGGDLGADAVCGRTYKP